MKRKSKFLIGVGSIGLAVVLAVALVIGLGGGAAFASGTYTVYYTGQGLYHTGNGGYGIQTEICGVANGADVDGAYLHWVLTATKATSATITLPDGTVPMVPNGGGSFSYNSGWYSPLGSLINTVFATYSGTKTNAQLVISHGCAPNLAGAWCSPGFWANTLRFSPNAWTTIGVDPTTALFNGNVSPAFYANDINPDELLTYVLNHPGSYGGTLGTAGPYGLTAFNATAAYLTNQIPGYSFSLAAYNAAQGGDDTHCPLDAHGNLIPLA